jgi:hypothetical protein
MRTALSLSLSLVSKGLGFEAIPKKAWQSRRARRTCIALRGEATEIAHLEAQQRARLAFEQLGPTFVKLGQMLSTREDLLPPSWTTELARLHSDVAPVPFDDLLPQVEQAVISRWRRRGASSRRSATFLAWSRQCRATSRGWSKTVESKGKGKKSTEEIVRSRYQVGVLAGSAQ